MASKRFNFSELLIKAARHLRGLMSYAILKLNYAIVKLDRELRISEYSRACNKGERLVIKDWETPSNFNSYFSFWAHIQRYEWVLPLVRNAKILDGGCGSGYGAHYLATHGAKLVVGIDISRDAIKFALRHYNAQNLVFIQMDACKLQFNPCTFDAIVSFDVLEHVPSNFNKKFVSETARVLKPSGTLYIGCPNGTLSRGGNPYHYELSYEKLQEILSKYYGTVELLGQDIVINDIRQGRDWYKHINNISRENLVIVEHSCESAFGLLAICRNPVADTERQQSNPVER